MTKPRRRLTAAEIRAITDADDEYQAVRQAREAQRREHELAWDLAEAPLLSELRSRGMDLSSVWDLIPRSEPYPEEIPVLVEHLARPYPDRVREGIARALAVPESRPFWDAIADCLYSPTSGPDALDGISVALVASVSPENHDRLIQLIQDESLGDCRQTLLLGLSRLGASSRDDLAKYVSDPVLGAEARRLLTARRAP